MDAVAERDDVGGAGVLDLQHRALVRLVGVVEALGDDAVQTRSLELGEPASRGRGIFGRPGHVHGRLDARQQILELGAARGERCLAQIAVAASQQVEDDEQGGRLVRQLRDAGGGGVDARAERLPVQPLRAPRPRWNDDLAVDEARLRQHPRQRLDQFGEVPGERLRAARSQLHALPVPRREHPVR